MQLNANGNLGIGTTTPSVKLDIALAGTSAAIKVRNTDTPTGGQQAWIDLGFSDSRRLIFSAAGDNIGVSALNAFNYINSLGKPLAFAENTVNILTISGGNVGIGTTTPAARLDIADTTLAGSGSLAGSILNLAQTWNTTGAPTAIKLNVTNTASGAASNLLDLQVNSVSRFKIDKAGAITVSNSIVGAGNLTI